MEFASHLHNVITKRLTDYLVSANKENRKNVKQILLFYIPS